MQDLPNREKITWKQLFKWRNDDKITIIVMSAPMILIWILLLFHSKLNTLYISNDSIINIYIAKYFYNLNPLDGGSFRFDPQKINSHLIGCPFLIKILSFFLFHNWTLTSMIYSLATSILCGLLFKRFLLAWNIVTDPLLTSSLLSIFPLRFYATRMVVASDSLYLCFVFLAFISYRATKLKQLFWSIVFASFFSENAIALSLSFFLCFFRFEHYGKALKMLLAYICGVFPTLFFQLLFNGNPVAFYQEKYSLHGNFTFIPFSTFIQSTQGVIYLPQFHTYLYLFFPALIALVFLNSISFLFPCFIGFTFLYMSMFDFIDIFRLSIPLEVFSFLIGFDFLLQSVKFRKSLPIFFGLYFIGASILTFNSVAYDDLQNMSNRFVFSKIFPITS